MSAADKLTQVTRHVNTVDDLAAEGRNYGDDYMAALETSAADVPALRNALKAVLDVAGIYDMTTDENGAGRGLVETEVIRKAIDEALS